MQHGISPKCFVDNNKWKSGGASYLGLPVISAAEFFENYGLTTLVFIACSAKGAAEIKAQLYENGHTNAVIYYQEYRYAINDISANRELIHENSSTIDAVVEALADEKSVKVFANLLKYRLTFDPELIHEIVYKNQYFNNDVISFFHGNFVDGGAFDGDTLKELIAWDNGSYEHYYAFEPDEITCGLLSEYAAALENVHVTNAGLWDKDDTLSFSSTSSSSSRITDDGSKKIHVSPLDALLKDKVDFIKMDIEGAEMEALRGAAKTIAKYRPTMAICIYHKAEHLWKIPEFILSLNPDYKLYIRHYSENLTETVCYATK